MLSAGQQCCEKTGAKLLIHHEDDVAYHSKQKSSLNNDQLYCNEKHLEAIKKCSGITAIWKPIANDLHRYNKPILVLPPGLNDYEILNENKRKKTKIALCNKLGIPEEHLLIGYSGSIRYLDTEFETFLKAFKEVVDTNYTVHLLIWGRDWNPHLTYSLLEKYSLTDRASLLGLLPENIAFKLQQSVDILCCPGLNSQFNYYRLPSRLCNYFKFGKPVVTHKIGFGESLQHQENVILTETDNYEEWAQKILLLINNKELIEKLSQNAILVAENFFDTQKNTISLIQFYQKIISDSDSNQHYVNNIQEIKCQNYNKPSYDSKYKLCARNNAKLLKSLGKKSIAFYGAGNHTKEMLASGEFEDFNIVGIIDSNAQGQLNGIPIYSPSESNLPYWDALLLSTDSQEHLMYQEAENHNFKRLFSMYSFLYASLAKVQELND